MSHEATNWAFKVKGLKPATKMVLIGLADCHNPVHGCFPSKKHLAEMCEISERSVADQIKKLEDEGLICIEKRGGGSGGQFSANRYILGFEGDFCRRKNLPSEKSTDGENECLPSAKSAVDRRQNLPSNPVIEPCKEPVSDAGAISFSEFWSKWPLGKIGKQNAEKAFKRLSVENKRNAIDRAQHWAKCWREKYPNASDMHPASYLNGKRWEDEFAKPSQQSRQISDRRGAVIPSQQGRQIIPPSRQEASK